MRICFVGTVEGSETAFKALVQANRAPSLVVTLPREAAERHSDFVDLTTPATALGIPVHNTSNINMPETLEVVAKTKPDLTLVIGWSQICREPFRAIGKLGTIGFHPSPLPRMRGRGVIPWTILREEATSGSTLFWLDEGTDSGDILLQRLFSVDEDETARSLYNKHTVNIREMVPEAIELIEAGNPPRILQNELEASYCAKRRPEDGLIDWNMSTRQILNFVRAVGDPYPGSFTCYGGEKLHIDEVAAYPFRGRYVGFPGQVQAHTDGGFIVMCGDDECVDVRKWRLTSGRRPAVHARIG